jgi:hypothetical protein
MDFNQGIDIPGGMDTRLSQHFQDETLKAVYSVYKPRLKRLWVWNGDVTLMVKDDDLSRFVREYGVPNGMYDTDEAILDRKPDVK